MSFLQHFFSYNNKCTRDKAHGIALIVGIVQGQPYEIGQAKANNDDFCDDKSIKGNIKSEAQAPDKDLFDFLNINNSCDLDFFLSKRSLVQVQKF